ncbi:hypothetical protein GGS23DRAFT_592779 [Durotheca rogersii]|uniref:uncharacterized protein n=1 Tax=Durotheca rogersii TaxID=419775 RepID=UPI0022207DB5|nr:uncharacterized protein GGS23DRAFT_592779 [Durotheca rogersii]KAI5867466.1 hypothetical protein GGS23DRAFT_592779 [Durotheca rogersii]
MRASILLAGLAALSSSAASRPGKKRLIIDTDMLNFDDDPLAIGLANIFQAWGQVEFIGVMSSINSRFAPPAIDAINTFYGHPDIPIALRKPVNNLTQWPQYPQYGDYLTGLTYNFTQDIQDGVYTPDPVSSYRYLLSTSADSSVTIAAIGFFGNLYGVLQSGGDAISPRTGAELLAAKVGELVVQADERGRSFNTGWREGAEAAAVLNWWPGRATFAGDAVAGATVLGRRLTAEPDPARHPLAYALRRSIGPAAAHPVWDAVAVYYAVCGAGDVFAPRYPRGGRVALNASAYATWAEPAPAAPPGPHNALDFRLPNDTFAARLEDTLLWEPGSRVPRERTWCKN